MVQIDDAQEDPKFADDPLVIWPPYIRFYGGVPLLSIERHAIETLRVIDQVPRMSDKLKLATLVDLARMAKNSLIAAPNKKCPAEEQIGLKWFHHLRQTRIPVQELTGPPSNQSRMQVHVQVNLKCVAPCKKALRMFRSNG